MFRHVEWADADRLVAHDAWHGRCGRSVGCRAAGLGRLSDWNARGFWNGNAEDDDPSGGEGWGPDRQVRAEVLAMLLCGAVDVEQCYMPGGIDLSEATTRTLDL